MICILYKFHLLGAATVGKNQGANREKAASGAFQYFVRNPAILRIFYVKNPECLTKFEERRVEDRKLRMDQVVMRLGDRK